ncbi:MAG: glycosyltransferase [Myxococcales bacterium]|nr:glycosyltransferase [Myxococcales bacterium]
MRNPVRKIAFVGNPDRNVAEALREYGYRVEGVQTDSIVGLARELYRMKPSVVHARQNHLKAGVVAKLLDIPLLIQAGRHDLGSLTAHAARMASRTLCGGASVREALIGHGAPAASTCVLRSLLDVHDDLRAATIFPPMLDPAIHWVVAASPCDGPDRGHQDLVLAFLSLARARPKLKLLIAGEGCEGRKLRAQADQAGMLNRVVVHTVALEQLPAVFARAVAVVGPSRSGNSPDAVPEALAVGAPVVATAIGSHPTWVREGRTGWLVPPRAPAALAARLAQIVDDPQTARKVGAQARLAALELVAPRAVAQELARCYAAIGRVPALQHTGIYFPAPRLQRA